MTTNKEYLDRLKARIEVNENDCWEWRGYKDADGYGAIRYKGKVVRTHRLMYQLAVADIGGLHVCHHCDNPSCINPIHLFLGTHKDNMHDAMRKSRLSIVKTSADNFNAKLTLEAVVKYRKLYQSGATIDAVMELANLSRTATCSMLQGRTYKDAALFPRNDAMMNVKGESAPTFKGYYITPWGEFTSLHDAANASGEVIHFSTIDRYCKRNNKLIIRASSVSRSTYLTKQDIGKTYAELGFGFREVN